VPHAGVFAPIPDRVVTPLAEIKNPNPQYNVVPEELHLIPGAEEETQGVMARPQVAAN
jgi:hypothetical protein